MCNLTAIQRRKTNEKVPEKKSNGEQQTRIIIEQHELKAKNQNS